MACSTSQTERGNSMVYQWKDGSRITADAQAVGQEIAEIGKEITARDVVNKARVKATALHECFEWDDTAAADEYRLTQAREVMRSLVFVQEPEDGEEEPRTYRFLENVDLGNAETGRRRAYVPIKRWIKDDGLKVQVFARLESMLHEAENIAADYEHLEHKLGAVKVKAHEARELIPR